MVAGAQAHQLPFPKCSRRAHNAAMFRYSVITIALAQLLLQTAGLAQQPFALRVITTGLKGPWEIVLGPDDRLWVTERLAGRVIRVNPADGAVTPAVTI